MELIILIVVISWVLKSKKKKDGSKPVATAQRRQQPAVQSRAKISQNTPQVAKTPTRPVQSKVPQKKPDEMSTMEMLEAKAREDDREEMLEKQRRKIENKKHYGHLNYAEKYILGDAVPKGRKMVFCTYCGAENLIPTYSAAKEYNCYFCREDL